MERETKKSFLYTFEGLDVATQTISLSKVDDSGAKVTPLVDSTRLHLAFTEPTTGTSVDINVFETPASQGNYGVAPRWLLERCIGRKVNCLLRLWPGDLVVTEQFNVVD